MSEFEETWRGAAMIRKETIERLEEFAKSGHDMCWRDAEEDWIMPADVYVMIKTLRQSAVDNKALLDANDALVKLLRNLQEVYARVPEILEQVRLTIGGTE